MRKLDKREIINLFFSAFLVIAFIICAHFFSQFTATLNVGVGTAVTMLIYAVFGLFLFYATRVGDGKAIKRFSVPTLVVMVLPSLYIMIAAVAPGLPFHDAVATPDGGLNLIVTLASIALGYGIPYTFLSGFEAEPEVITVPAVNSDEVDSAEDLVAEEAVENSDEVADEQAEETAEEATESSVE